MEEALTIKPCGWSQQVKDLLASAHHYDTTGGFQSPEWYEKHGGMVFTVCKGETVVGAYVLYVNDWSEWGGMLEGVIAYAAATGKVPDLIDRILPIIEQQFKGVHAITVHTNRKGLIRKLARHGYGFAGAIMRKKQA